MVACVETDIVVMRVASVWRGTARIRFIAENNVVKVKWRKK